MKSKNLSRPVRSQTLQSCLGSSTSRRSSEGRPSDGWRLRNHHGGYTEDQFWYEVTVHEGRNRLIRRLWERLGYDVLRLIRVSFGQFQLDQLEGEAWKKFRNWYWHSLTSSAKYGTLLAV